MFRPLQQSMMRWLYAASLAAAGTAAADIALPEDATEWRFYGQSGNVIDRWQGPGTLEAFTGGSPDTTFGSFQITDGTTIPHISGTEASYLHYSPLPSQFRLNTGVGNGGSGIPQYSLVFDMYLTSATWASMYRDTSDRFFLKPNDNGYWQAGTHYNDPTVEYQLDAWNRFVYINDALAGDAKVYVNGVLSQDFPAANPAVTDADAGTPYFLVLTDDTSENSSQRIANLAFVPDVLTTEEIQALGGANAEGIFGVIPEPSAAILVGVGALLLLRKRSSSM